MFSTLLTSFKCNILFFVNVSGADITKNDGIYSRYFTDITVDGYYGIKISVVNKGTAIVIDTPPSSRAIPNIQPDNANNLPEIGEILFLCYLSKTE